MRKTGDQRLISALGQTRHGASAGIVAHLIVLLHIGDQVLDQLTVDRIGIDRKETLAAVSAGEVLLDRLGYVGFRIRYHDDHRQGFLFRQKIVEDLRCATLYHPGSDRVAEAMIEIEHR